MYSNIYTRAGLIALTFILIISLVSAAPIPTTSTLFPKVRHCLSSYFVSILTIHAAGTTWTSWQWRFQLLAPGGRWRVHACVPSLCAGVRGGLNLIKDHKQISVLGIFRGLRPVQVWTYIFSHSEFFLLFALKFCNIIPALWPTT